MLIHKVIIRGVAIGVIVFWLVSFGWILAEGPVWSVVLPSILLSSAMALGFLFLHNFGRLAFLLLWVFLVLTAVQNWWSNSCCDGTGPLSYFNRSQLLQALAGWPLCFLLFAIYLFHSRTSKVFKGLPRFYRAREQSIPSENGRAEL